MKKKFIKLTTLAVATVIASSFTLTACAPTPDPDTGDEGEYSVVLNYNDNVSLPRTMYIEEGKSVEKIATPLYEGYQLSHWTIGSDDGETVTLPYTPTGDVQLFAHWQPAVYNVSFNWNYEGQTSTVVPVEYNSTVNAPAEADYPEHPDGDVFFAWNMRADGQGSEVTFPYTVKRATEFYAQWVPADAKIYTIHFDANYEDAPAIEQTVRIVEGQTALQRTDVPTPTRDRHSFRGWALTADATENDLISYPYTPAPDTEGTDVTLYAVWQRVNQRVRFRTNFVHQQENTEDNFDNRFFVPGDVIESAPETPEKPETLDGTNMSDFEFEGWFDARVGGNEITFPYTTPDNVRGNIDIYAHWQYKRVETDRFDAEFTFISPTLQGQGTSNDPKGVGIIVDDYDNNTGAWSSEYPLLTALQQANGHLNKFVTYLMVPGLGLTFRIHSDSNVTNATLYASLAAEVVTNLVLTSADGPMCFRIAVNGTNIDYGQISFVGDPEVVPGAVPYATRFKEVRIGQISLNEGWNEITMIVANETAPSGTTMRATAPRIDGIRVDTTATLSWHPEYGNVYRQE